MGSLSLNYDSAIKHLYSEYTPAYDNLYDIQVFDEPVQNSESSNKVLTNYIEYHATKITIPEEKLTLDRNNVTKLFQLSKNDSPYQWGNQVTITWSESDDWRVKKYHEEWMGKFYQKEYNGKFDVYISATTSDNNLNERYKKIRIYLPSTSATETKENKNVIVLDGCLPSNTGRIALGWKINPSIVNHEMTYYVSNIYWENK